MDVGELLGRDLRWWGLPSARAGWRVLFLDRTVIPRMLILRVLMLMTVVCINTIRFSFVLFVLSASFFLLLSFSFFFSLIFRDRISLYPPGWPQVPELKESSCVNLLSISTRHHAWLLFSNCVVWFAFIKLLALLGNGSLLPSLLYSSIVNNFKYISEKVKWTFSI